jgi:hypothetical protein
MINPFVQVQKQGKIIECACGYIGEAWEHSLHSHTILSIFPIFKTIAKYIPKEELGNLRDAFPRDVELENSIHQILCKTTHYCTCWHIQIVTIL